MTRPEFVKKFSAVLLAAAVCWVAAPTPPASAVPLYYTSFEEYGAPVFVARITVTNPGSGYTSPPTVTVVGGRGSGANASVTIENGQITHVNMINYGSGYGAPGSVSFVGGGGKGASGIVEIRDGGISGVRIEGNATGCGYTSQPQVVFSPGGTPALAQANVSGGKVTSIDLIAPGDGYTSVPTVQIAGGGGSGATATAALQPVALAGISIDNAGTGYTSPPDVIISGGGGSGGQATVSVINGHLANVTLVSPGQYTSLPTITVQGGGGSGGTLRASLARLSFMGTEWQKPPAYPWAQNSNDPMNIVNGGRTGNKAANQAETFSQWSAMHDIGYPLGADPADNFYVKAWINFGRERERLVNPGVTPCSCALPGGPPDYWQDWTDAVVYSGAITSADDGGSPINYPGWPACRVTKPSISDANTYYSDLRGNATIPTFVLTMLSGDAAGKQWIVQAPEYYTCGGPPYGTIPVGFCDWDYNHRLQVTPKAPNSQNPVAAGVKPGDTYEIRGSVAPLYRAVQMFVDNANQDDFAKFGIWHRYSGAAECNAGSPNSQCRDSNDWKYLVKETGGTPHDFLDNPWTDTGIWRGPNFTGWHSYEVRVYGDNADPNKDKKFQFFVDGNLIATAPRYTAQGLVPLNRVEIGGLAVSQESAQWDDFEIGLLPESGSVTQLSSVGAVKDTPEGTWVALPPAVVDAAGDTWYHVQGPGRAGGVRCLYDKGSSETLKPGDVVVATGKVTTPAGTCEKVISALNPHVVQRGAPYLPPVWVNYRDLRGDYPSLLGAYIATWGEVINTGEISPDYFYIDDHSDPSGNGMIKVYTGSGNNVVSPYIWVTVRGILGCENGQRVIRIANDNDVDQDP